MEIQEVAWFFWFLVCYPLVLMGLGICAKSKYGSVSAFVQRSKKSRYVTAALPVSMVLFIIYMFIAMIISGDG